MKKIILYLTFMFLLLHNTLVAQTDRDILLEIVRQQTKLSDQQTKLSEQQAKLSEQQAVSTAKFDAKFDGVQKQFEGVQKQLDVLFYTMIAIMTGIFGLFALIVWDRRTVAKPFETKTEEMQKEITSLKEKQLKLEKRQLKSESNFKKIAQIDDRFSAIV